MTKTRVSLASGIRVSESVTDANAMLARIEDYGAEVCSVSYAGYHNSRHYFVIVAREETRSGEPVLQDP